MMRVSVLAAFALFGQTIASSAHDDLEIIYSRMGADERAERAMERAAERERKKRGFAEDLAQGRITVDKLLEEIKKIDEEAQKDNGSSCVIA